MVKALRLAGRAVATVLLSGAVAGGCGAPAEKAASPAATRPAAPAAGGNGAPASPAAGNPLSGTAWRLIEIQSMDDAVGSTGVADPSLYTMRLNADGSVALRLNCNSATGTWSAEAAALGSVQRPIRVRAPRRDDGLVPASQPGRAGDEAGTVLPFVPAE